MASVSERTDGADRSSGRQGAAGADWLELCRTVVSAQRELFEREHGIAARTVYEGIGEGGDRALAIDRRCEDIAFAELERLHVAGASFTAISEERGEVVFGDGGEGVRVVIDPLDGSLNARRTLPSFAFSLAVATGPGMKDVVSAYVYDFGAGEEFWAERDRGATLDGAPLAAEGPGHGLEVVGLEGAKPERLMPVLEGLAGQVFRIRSVGSIALSLCYVAAGRFDGMLTARASRSVDAAAGQLIVREAGAVVEFTEAGAGASLALDARYHVAAALDAQMLEPLLAAQERAEPAGT